MADIESFLGKVIDDNEICVVRNFREFDRHYHQMIPSFVRRKANERAMMQGDAVPFKVNGYCRVCRAETRFGVDYLSVGGRGPDGVLQPNWRESVICESCGLINRVRCATDFFTNHLKAKSDSRIYIAEQLTPFFQWLKTHFPLVAGSEFLGDEYAPGQVVNGIRHEDMTGLSFADGSLDFVLSFDVLEHVPDYKKALAECMRCLKPGGVMLSTAPFAQGSEKTIVRARIGASGAVEHLLEPEYHGNPTRPEEGSLCFYHFGWDIIEDLRQAGAVDAGVVYCYSERNGYLGDEQVFFMAVR